MPQRETRCSPPSLRPMRSAAGGSAADRENRTTPWPRRYSQRSVRTGRSLRTTGSRTKPPAVRELAHDLTTVLAVKDTALYGTTFLTEAKLKAALRSATHLVEAADSA